MIQQIITLVIVFATISFVIYKLVKSMLPSPDNCGPCKSSCGGCPVHELKEEIAVKQSSKMNATR